MGSGGWGRSAPCHSMRATGPHNEVRPGRRAHGKRSAWARGAGLDLSLGHLGTHHGTTRVLLRAPTNQISRDVKTEMRGGGKAFPPGLEGVDNAARYPPHGHPPSSLK